MMLHPSYKELMEKVNASSETGEKIVKSRYSIVLGTAKRARQITAAEFQKLEAAKKDEKTTVANDKPIFKDARKKPLSIAVEELDRGDIHILSEASEDYESYVPDENGRV